jgi:hypothetical protein
MLHFMCDFGQKKLNIFPKYSETPVTRPIMGPMSDGHVRDDGRVSEVENLVVNFPPKNCVPRSADWRCNIKWRFYVCPLYFAVFAHEWLCINACMNKNIFSPCVLHKITPEYTC